jgi:hypothetical protein
MERHKQNILTNLHYVLVEDSFCDEHENAQKPVIVQEYNRHMEYVDISDHMTGTGRISKCTWKWMKKIVLLSTGAFNSE